MGDKRKKKKKRRIGIGRYFRKPYRKHHHYEPFYDAHADYNTNSKSYYDYLARFNYYIHVITDSINRLLNRNIEFDETYTVKFDKNGDWIDNGKCEPDDYDDIINITADVKVSNNHEVYTILSNNQTLILNNAIEVFEDGLYVKDFTQVIEALDNAILQNKNDIENIYEILGEHANKITNIEETIINQGNSIQKIIDNLFESGAITTNNINNFEFKNNRHIATGNINLFGGEPDGNYYIKTSDNKKENDITAGY